MRTYFAQITILLVTLCVFPLAAQQTQPSEFSVTYDSSGLTVVKVNDGKLECTYHTNRKDERRPRLAVQSFAPFDSHVSRISLTDAELKELREWALAAINTKATEEQMRDQNGYHTALAIRMDGKTYLPDHATAGALWAWVKRIIADRTKAALQ